MPASLKHSSALRQIIEKSSKNSEFLWTSPNYASDRFQSFLAMYNVASLPTRGGTSVAALAELVAAGRSSRQGTEQNIGTYLLFVGFPVGVLPLSLCVYLPTGFCVYLFESSAVDGRFSFSLLCFYPFSFSISGLLSYDRRRESGDVVVVSIWYILSREGLGTTAPFNVHAFLCDVFGPFLEVSPSVS